MLLNGLTILSDWIASNARWFPFAGSTDPATYPGLSRERADRAVTELGLLDFLPAVQSPTYARLFPARPEARPLQRALEPHELPALPLQCLILIEAPTGEGKTEAALLLAARLASEGRSRGLYFALPTVATSNQMYSRVRSFLGEHSPAILINGLAELSEQLDSALGQIPDIPHEVIADETRAQLDPWFLPRKRSLLAPYGVGTIDQAMIGALHVRHGSLRLLGLSGKVVVVDEVHAYDVYMSTIILRLLSWLRALGANVILLSATLPTRKRRELIAAYAHADASFVPAAAYPLVTIVPAHGKPQILEPAASCGSRTVLLERRPDGAAERTQNAARLLDQVRNGGCACWICNTVKEAQMCYLELRDQLASRNDQPAPELLLFHARFPVARRQQVETQILGRFGPDGERPERAILVATQVVEQSLDLDFDLIVTQLCPADLLLQRIGRLQRHQRPARSLDAGRPRCVLLLPPAADEGPEFGDYSYVYSPFVLLKTMLALHGRASLHIPEDVRALVDAVYDDTVPSAEQAAAAGL
jgi:CRISPR-associated endonuclease/helicase Cas3